jgi:hypothetical protein
MSAYPHTLSPTAHTIHVSDDVIDAGRLIALARELDTTECPGALGDDNQNGWFGLKPKWSFRLSLPGDTDYKAIIVKLVTLGGRRDDYSVVLKPETPRETTLPAFDRSHKIYCKHMGSQLCDCLFRVSFRNAAEQVWLQAKWLDTGLLSDLLVQRSREDIRQAVDSAYRQRAAMYGDTLEDSIRERQEDEMSRYIDPAYRAYFAMQGHVFQIDRSGPELVLIPEGERK